jgi:2-keto-3-deoxy-L-rhamnonate aldolase RhmA
MYALKKRLKSGELLIGTMISEVRNPNIAYMLAQNGYDFLLIDNEHGSYSPETVSDLVAASRGAGIAPVVRIPEIRRETILKPLDAGAAGLLVPQVMFHAKYPPAGNRGAALRRPHALYHKVSPVEYMREANEETLIAVQAETPESIQNLEAIAAVPGVDVVFVGPFDLSISLGFPGEINHPREMQAIERVVEVCRQSSIASGIHLFDIPTLKLWIEKGMRFLSYGSDVSFLADAAAAGLAELRKSTYGK